MRKRGTRKRRGRQIPEIQESSTEFNRTARQEREGARSERRSRSGGRGGTAEGQAQDRGANSLAGATEKMDRE